MTGPVGGAVSATGDRVVIGALASASFAVIYSASVIAPLVTQIAGEFGLTAGAVGVVAASYAIPGMITGAVAGPFSDRHGRRAFLVGGCALLGGGTFASAFASDVVMLAALRAAGGLGAAMVLPNVQAALADRFELRRRQQLIALIFMANVIGGLAGVWVTGTVAERAGWRVALMLSGAVGLGAALANALAPMRRALVVRASLLGTYARVLADRSAAALLLANFLGVIAWQAWALYAVLFFQREYGLAEGAASTCALVFGLGMLLGTQLGGRRRIGAGQRATLALSLLGYGLLLVLMAVSRSPLPLAAAIALAAAACYGLRATANAMLMTEQVPLARSTMLGLSQTTVSAASAFSGAAAGVVVDASGFGALALLCLIAAALSGAITFRLVREVGLESDAATG